MFKHNKTTLMIISIALYSVLWATSVSALVDPTMPPVSKVNPIHKAIKKISKVRWTLHSTLISPERRTAVINNRVVSKGDHINGAIVLGIQPSTVQLRDKGRVITLIMINKDVKSLSPVDPSGQEK